MSGPYREVSLAVGQSMTLQCHAAGSPAPLLAWYRGLLLPHSTDTLVVSGFKMDLKVTLAGVVLYLPPLHCKCYTPHSLRRGCCEMNFAADALSKQYKSRCC